MKITTKNSGIDFKMVFGIVPWSGNNTLLKICNKSPNWISDESTALSAIEKMNAKKITSLLVTQNQYMKKKTKKIVGILHMHQCLSRGIK